jgi:hypothetical protein
MRWQRSGRNNQPISIQLVERLTARRERVLHDVRFAMKLMTRAGSRVRTDDLLMNPPEDKWDHHFE